MTVLRRGGILKRLPVHTRSMIKNWVQATQAKEKGGQTGIKDRLKEGKGSDLQGRLGVRLSGDHRAG